MPRFERMPLHEESDRAPSGVCELTVQATNNNAFDIGPQFESAINDYVEPGINVKAISYNEPSESDRLVVYTGTDRLDLATLRDISEIYGQITKYDSGNIPPELSVVPTSRNTDSNRYFAWFEFKLEMEIPASEIQLQLKKHIDGVEVTPKNPVGENMESIVYRIDNVANHQVREIINMASTVRDALPINYIRLVCESKE